MCPFLSVTKQYRASPFTECGIETTADSATAENQREIFSLILVPTMS